MKPSEIRKQIRLQAASAPIPKPDNNGPPPAEATVRDALAVLPSDDYHVWIKYGIALKHDFGATGKGMWIEWAKRSHKWEDGDENRWHTMEKVALAKHIKPIRTATIVYHARKAGHKIVTEFASIDVPPREVAAATDVVLTLPEFMKYKFKKREMLLGPLISTQSLNMIYGDRGVGKTHFAGTLAVAAASGGSAFDWKAARPVKTLYLDGEMPGSQLQDWFGCLRGLAEPAWDASMLRIYTPDAQSGGIPDLSIAAGRARIDSILGDAELIFIDNVSAWVRGESVENAAEDWTPVLEWMLRMRQQGRSVVFLHHEGKTSGKQRGTGKREDGLDITLWLKRPDNYQEAEGCRFEVHFTKKRGIYGKDVIPFEARFSDFAGVLPHWEKSPVRLSNTQRILELNQQGIKQALIAKELGVNPSRVSRVLAKPGNKQGNKRR